MKARHALAGLAALAGFALAAPAASGHPLGNFTTNQLAQVAIDTDRTRVSYVLDVAEIPSFRYVQRFDRNGDGEVTGGERRPLLAELEREVSSGLALSADGVTLPLGDPQGATLSFPSGQGGLSLTRLELTYAAPLEAGTERVELTNDAFADLTGWRAIQVLPGEGTDVTSTVSASDPTDGLRAYPEDLLESPPDNRVARFDVAEGTGAVTGPDGLQGGGATGDRSGDGFADALAGGETGGLLILLLLGAAFGWGALHALSPGHGKAMVAGYLAGSRGRPRDAVVLGATVTITHTAAVFALGLVTLSASELILPERLYPWLSIASGAMVVTIGLWVMWRRFKRWRQLRADVEAERVDDHHHDHDHDHHHDHDPSAPVRLRELIGLGVSGGIVPCPSALVVLIAAISQHRVGLGMVLILAFSLGLAATVTGVGLVTIWGGRLVARLRPERRLFGGRLVGALPALSASVIVLAGALITVRAIPELG